MLDKQLLTFRSTVMPSPSGLISHILLNCPKMKALRFFETSIDLYQLIRRHIPQHHFKNSQKFRCL
jgi:hypothetical protein